MDMKHAINQVINRQDLSSEAMTAVMHTIMTGGATPAQIGGFLVGLRMKGETVIEIAAAAAVMRELATPIDLADLPHLIDIVGTGGDAASTFNVSTACIFVAAAAGCQVAKHGNRSVSSKSGSADVLEAAGVRLDLTPEQLTRCVRQLGVGFMFAPHYHSAMQHAIGPRRQMGVRTLFNVLGPLTNPARVPNQLLGIFDRALLMPLAAVLQHLGSNHVLVVNADDGLDEISIAAPTAVAELNQGTLRQFRIQPEDFGLARAALSTVQVQGAAASLALIHNVLNNQPGAARDMVLLNAGAAIYAAGVGESLQDGIARAEAALRSGAARYKLEQLITFSQSDTL